MDSSLPLLIFPHLCWVPTDFFPQSGPAPCSPSADSFQETLYPGNCPFFCRAHLRYLEKPFLNLTIRNKFLSQKNKNSSSGSGFFPCEQLCGEFFVVAISNESVSSCFLLAYFPNKANWLFEIGFEEKKYISTKKRLKISKKCLSSLQPFSPQKNAPRLGPLSTVLFAQIAVI
jgi:hypothetical protein